MSTQLEDYEDEDTFRILLATDLHLGYNEKVEIRDEDSFVAFEEILNIAVAQNVDFLLLGGDLFHDCKPSPYCIRKCSELIKRYCFGDKPVEIEFMSDQSEHFKHQMNPIVNYEDPNINVSLPIFSIHGNHDDPTGNKKVSPMDLMASNGLINYFGRYGDYRQIDLMPILLKKGDNKLALYGLSHIHDQRLARLFRDQKVSMIKPAEDDWFNLMVLHQNRAPRGANNFIPASCIPNLIDLVMWGHEHDSLIVPEKQENGVWITQPGSSVATSLSEGESLPKHVGLLLVKEKNFFLKPIPLQTVRPFIFTTLVLDDPKTLKNKDFLDMANLAVETVSKKIEQIIEKVATERKANNLKEMVPLIRIVVRYHDEQQAFNPIRLNQHFIGRVANADDIVLLKRVVLKGEPRQKNRFMNADELDEELIASTDGANYIGDVIDKELANHEMKILSVNSLTVGVTRFVEHEDADAFKDLFDYQKKQIITAIKEMNANDKNIEQAIDNLYQTRSKKEDDVEIAEINKVLQNSNRRFTRVDQTATDDPQVNDATPDTSATTSKRGRGRGRGGATRKPRGKK